MSSKYGLLIDYKYCTGCHSCEVACQQEHNYPAEKFGITVSEHILETMNGLSIYYLPFPTDLCDFCFSRVKYNKKPSCVKHCLASCITFGPLDELVKKAKELEKSVLFSHS